MSFNEFWQYLTGPRLFRIFKFRDSPGRPYVPNSVELYSDKVIQTMSMFGSVALYSSPIIIIYLYRKGLFTTDNNYLFFNYTFIRIATTLTFVYFGSLLIRGIGRSTNSDYKSFTKVLMSAKQKNDLSRLTLSRFEFEFNHWPIDFRWFESKLMETKKPPQLVSHSSQSRRQLFLSIPCDIISYFVVKILGRPMLYPGSVGLFQYALSGHLLEGRTRLVEQNSGERYKLLARDGNQIDCMFVDRRGGSHQRAKTLVICSEGNAGFYEIGIMCTPLEAGYSVLGWNHPGFGGSTGLPYPQNDINAIDVVIQFAVERLGFSVDSILLFGWSIGGFPATWAGMQYPDVKGVILDASFDDVLPLAESKMPLALHPIVRNVIRNHFNLNVSENLNHFNGAVLFIRRTRDEIINTNDLQPLRTNRGNDLLFKLFRNRFPHLMSDEKVRNVLMEWLLFDPLSRQQFERRFNISDISCLKQIEEFITATSADHYPLQIGNDPNMTSETKIQLIVYLAKHHLKDFNSTHCTPLPAHNFEEPLDLFRVNKV